MSGLFAFGFLVLTFTSGLALNKHVAMKALKQMPVFKTVL